jgi:GTP-binding protein
MFVIDARAGLTPNDRAFADFARRANKPVVLVANKSEGKHGEVGAMESYALGLGDPVQISAEHGEGLSDLYDALRALMPEPARGGESSTMTTSSYPMRNSRKRRSASPSSAVPMPANPR